MAIRTWVTANGINTDNYLPQWDWNNSSDLKNWKSVVTTIIPWGTNDNVPTEKAVVDYVNSLNIYTTATDPALNTILTTAILDNYSGVIVTTTWPANIQTFELPTSPLPWRRFTVVSNDTSTDPIEIIGTSTITVDPWFYKTFIFDWTAWTGIESWPAVSLWKEIWAELSPINEWYAVSMKQWDLYDVNRLSVWEAFNTDNKFEVVLWWNWYDASHLVGSATYWNSTWVWQSFTAIWSWSITWIELNIFTAALTEPFVLDRHVWEWIWWAVLATQSYTVDAVHARKTFTLTTPFTCVAWQKYTFSIPTSFQKNLWADGTSSYAWWVSNVAWVDFNFRIVTSSSSIPFYIKVSDWQLYSQALWTTTAHPLWNTYWLFVNPTTSKIYSQNYYWKEPVESIVNLPSSNNVAWDVRVTLDTQQGYIRDWSVRSTLRWPILWKRVWTELSPVNEWDNVDMKQWDIFNVKNLSVWPVQDTANKFEVLAWWTASTDVGHNPAYFLWTANSTMWQSRTAVAWGFATFVTTYINSNWSEPTTHTFNAYDWEWNTGTLLSTWTIEIPSVQWFKQLDFATPFITVPWQKYTWEITSTNVQNVTYLDYAAWYAWGTADFWWDYVFTIRTIPSFYKFNIDNTSWNIYSDVLSTENTHLVTQPFYWLFIDPATKRLYANRVWNIITDTFSDLSFSSWYTIWEKAFVIDEKQDYWWDWSVRARSVQVSPFFSISTSTVLSSIHYYGTIKTTWTITITLPTAVWITWTKISFIKSDDYNQTLTLLTTSSQTVNSDTTTYINPQYTSFTVVSDWSNRLVL